LGGGATRGNTDPKITDPKKSQHRPTVQNREIFAKILHILPWVGIKVGVEKNWEEISLKSFNVSVCITVAERPDG